MKRTKFKSSTLFSSTCRQLQCILEDPDNPPPPPSPSAFSTGTGEGATASRFKGIEEEGGAPVMYNEKTGKKMTPAQAIFKHTRSAIGIYVVENADPITFRGTPETLSPFVSLLRTTSSLFIFERAVSGNGFHSKPSSFNKLRLATSVTEHILSLESQNPWTYEYYTVHGQFSDLEIQPRSTSFT